MKSSHQLRFFQYISYFLVIGCFLYLSGYFLDGAGHFLSSPAMPPSKADAVIVLGGDGGFRFSRALELIDAGYAHSLFISQPRGSAIKGTKLDQFAGRVAIYTDDSALNTFHEATIVRNLIAKNKWQNVLVVTDPPHVRRVDWVWQKVLSGTGCRYLVIASNPIWCNPDAWWVNRTCAIFVVKEYIKLLYYVLRY